MIRTAMDMANVAREFVSAMNQIKAANRNLQKYAADNPEEISLDLHDLILHMDRAVSLL